MMSFEDRQDLPGLRAGRIVTHYFGAETGSIDRGSEQGLCAK